jgi:hypothetical protein
MSLAFKLAVNLDWRSIQLHYELQQAGRVTSLSFLNAESSIDAESSERYPILYEQPVFQVPNYANDPHAASKPDLANAMLTP